MADLKIEILSRKLIKPYNPTPVNLQRYNLSVFDEFAPPIYWPMLYYYMSEGNNSRARNDERCDKLEKSLSQILTKFYPLAGRYMEDELYIHCGGQGVECIEAHVSGELSPFLQPSDSQIHALNKFLPWDVNTAAHSSIRPLLAVQINTFDCGGIVLGISISHVIADAYTLATFMNEWAKTCRAEMREDLYPSFGDLSSLFPAGTSPLPKPPMLSFPSVNLVTKIFWFDESRIAWIKESLVGSDGHFSKFVVVAAVIWKAHLDVALATHGHVRDSVLLLAMNMRDKSKAAPPTFDIACGNCAIQLIVLFEASKENTQLHDLMVLVRSAVEKQRARFEAANADDILAMYLKGMEEMFQGFRRDVDVYGCSSWCRFPLYEADFGWGKPDWVSYSASPGTILMDSKSGGIQAFITMREEVMNVFHKNLGIYTSVPIYHQ